MTYEPKVESKTFWNNRLFTFGAAILTILLFFFIIVFVYIPLRPQPIDTEVVAARKKTLSEVQAFQHKVATSYMWSDKEKGIVVVPVELAMELTVKDYSTSAMEQKWAKAREEAVVAYKAKLEAAKNPKPAAKDPKAAQPAETKAQPQSAQAAQKSEGMKMSGDVRELLSDSQTIVFEVHPLAPLSLISLNTINA